MDKLTIEEIKEAKAAAELQIVKILTELRIKTECKIHSVNLVTEEKVFAGGFIVGFEIHLKI